MLIELVGAMDVWMLNK